MKKWNELIDEMSNRLPEPHRAMSVRRLQNMRKRGIIIKKELAEELEREKQLKKGSTDMWGYTVLP